MERFSLDDLTKWFYKDHRKPLVLRGARQVGKSTLVRIFTEKYKLILHEINLERHYYLNDVFKTLDTSKIIAEIEGLTGEIKDTDKSLILLDEIQATPFAIQSLRYFYEDRKDLAVIAAGSLLEFTLADHSFSMPVGRIEYYHLGPMSFKEYLLARDEELFKFVNSIQLGQTVPHSYHQRLLDKQREYLFVGGMPEAVDTFIKSDSYEEVSDIQRNILGTYLDDFSKYAKKTELVRLQKVFRQIPVQVGRKIKYANFSREDRPGEIKSIIELLVKARLCWKIPHSDSSGIPLAAGINENIYKLIFIDTGLFNSMLGLQWNNILQMDERTLINEGNLAEQFIGQQLINLNSGRRNPELHYWLREGRSNNAEIDFVINAGNVIIPIEVKSGKSGTLKSLQQFALQKKSNITVRFDMNTPSIQRISAKVNKKDHSEAVTFSLLSLPLYMVEELPRILNELLQ